MESRAESALSSPRLAPHVAMVAGEASGDLLASLLMDGLSLRWPGFRASGIGGVRMVAQGFDAWWPSDRLSVFGYVDALRHYPQLAGIRRRLKDRLLAERPQVFVGVDAPDFNFGLEAPLKAAGIPTVHFVCPSIWAWRAERVHTLARAADHVLCLFPFEPELLARHGVAASYVGHPLAGLIPQSPDQMAARLQLGLPDGDGPIVAILPGSRVSEIQHLARRFFDAAVLMQQQRPGLRFVVPALPRLKAEIERHAHEAGLTRSVWVFAGRSHEVLAACDVTLIASGTATLEAALFKRPMVIAYHLNWLSWQLMRGKQLQPWVGLPNILCQSFVVPELIQSQAHPQALAREVLAWLDDPERVARVQVQFHALHALLRRDTSRLAADAIQALF